MIHVRRNKTILFNSNGVKLIVHRVLERQQTPKRSPKTWTTQLTPPRQKKFSKKIFENK